MDCKLDKEYLILIVWFINRLFCVFSLLVHFITPSEKLVSKAIHELKCILFLKNSENCLTMYQKKNSNPILLENINLDRISYNCP